MDRFIDIVYKLKDIKRTGWVENEVPNPETVASHSFGTALMAMLLAPSDIDREKAIRMALVHDLAESIIGDISPAMGVPEEEKHKKETAAMEDLCKMIDNKELVDLFTEYEQAETKEAKFVKVSV